MARAEWSRFVDGGARCARRYGCGWRLANCDRGSESDGWLGGVFVVAAEAMFELDQCCTCLKREMVAIKVNEKCERLFLRGSIQESQHYL